MAQTATNVAAAKPAVGGALSVAATTATLPTDATTALTGFTGLGYISEDGITESITRESDDIKAFGGDVVLSSQTEFSNTFQLTLIEVLNVDVLKEVFGASSVTGTLANGITVNVNSAELTERAWVFDLIVRGAVERLVIPNGKITEVGETTYSDSDVIGYDITITAYPDVSGNTQYKYIKQS